MKSSERYAIIKSMIYNLRWKCCVKNSLIAAIMSCGTALSQLLAGVTTDGETLPWQGVERLEDGEINPTCAWRWQKYWSE